MITASMFRAGVILLLALLAPLGHAIAQTPAAAGFEAEPVFEAKDLVAADLLQGPHFTVDPRVPVVGFIARFTIRSPLGEFSAHGLRRLPVRVNEIEAIAKLDEFSAAREFVAAAARAAVRPVTSAANMVVRPVETIAGIPGGVTRFFGRVGLAGSRVAQAATTPGQSAGERVSETTGRVGSVAVTALGFEQERRRLAERLGVDPYTTNEVLSAKLTDVAWVMFSGRLTITAVNVLLVPYSMAASSVSVTNRAIYDVPAADLVNRASATFAATGAPRAEVQALMQNPQYSLSALTALATALGELEGLPGRDTVVGFAAAAQTQDEVYFVTDAMAMLARRHRDVAPLSRVSAPGPILGQTAANALELPMPVDFVSWVEALATDLDREEFQAAAKAAFVTGRASALARTNLASRGWRLTENVAIAPRP